MRVYTRAGSSTRWYVTCRLCAGPARYACTGVPAPRASTTGLAHLSVRAIRPTQASTEPAANRRWAREQPTPTGTPDSVKRSSCSSEVPSGSSSARYQAGPAARDMAPGRGGQRGTQRHESAERVSHEVRSLDAQSRNVSSRHSSISAAAQDPDPKVPMAGQPARYGVRPCRTTASRGSTSSSASRFRACSGAR